MRTIRARLLIACLVVGLGLHVVLSGCGGSSGKASPTPGLTVEEQAVHDFALAQFEAVRSTIDPTDAETPSVRFLPNHVEVLSSRWCYCLDAAGRQIVRPVAVSRHLEPSLRTDLGTGHEAWLAEPLSVKDADTARALAASAFGVTGLGGADVATTAFREVILSLSAAEGGTPRYHRGRTTVLFGARAASPQPFSTAVVFGPDGEALRIETTHASASVASMARDLRAGIAAGRIGVHDLLDASLRVGTFSDSWAHRFELSAWSYESEDFLTTAEPSSNPYAAFTQEDFCNELPLPLDWYRGTTQFHYWTWYRWNEAGRHGGARGNWDPGAQAWQIPGVVLAHHARLGDYAISGGTPTQLTELVYCEGTATQGWRLVPWSEGNRFENAFFDDLEDCHVGVILTHGGPLTVPGTSHQPVQFRTNQNYWAYLHRAGDPGLGLNRLRYLLIGTCASMNWHHAAPKTGGGLPGDWMNFHVADGLRMACGHDGEYTSSDHDGWTFFSFYNVGDKVTDAWHLASMKDNSVNYPVTVAYGSTEAEVLSTLFDQRFQTGRAGTGWILAVASYPVPLAP